MKFNTHFYIRITQMVSNYNNFCYNMKPILLIKIILLKFQLRFRVYGANGLKFKDNGKENYYL